MTIGLGIIGAGSIGRVHAEAARRNGLRVAGAWDFHRDRADALVAAHGGRATDSLEELLGLADIDAVAIAVPNSAHIGCATRAFGAGKHVLLEKPMALSVAECDRILEARDEAGRVLQLGFVCRGSPTSRLAKRLIDAGRLGEIYHAKCSIYRRRGIPGLGGWFTTQAISGGGPLIDLGVHLIDLGRWLCGSPEALRASGATYGTFGHPIEKYRFVEMWAGPPKIDGVFDVEDHATALVRFDGGLTVELNVTWAMNQPESALPEGIRLFGDQGGVAFRVFEKDLVLATEEEGRIVDVTPKFGPEDPLASAWDEQYRQFRGAIADGVGPHATGEDGRAVQAIVEAIARSSEEGREVEVRERVEGPGLRVQGPEGAVEGARQHPHP